MLTSGHFLRRGVSISIPYAKPADEQKLISHTIHVHANLTLRAALMKQICSE